MNRFNYALGSKLDRNRYNGYHFSKHLCNSGDTLTEFVTFEGLRVRMLTCDATRSISFFFQDGSGYSYVVGTNGKVLSRHAFDPDTIENRNHTASTAVAPAANRLRLRKSARHNTRRNKSVAVAEAAS